MTTLPESSVANVEPSQLVSTVLPLKQMTRGTPEWSLALYPAHLALAQSPNAQPFVIVREQMMKTAVLVDMPPMLTLTKPFKASFALSPDAWNKLAEWIGKPLLAQHALKRRYSWILPAAFLWMFSSLPLPANAAAGLAAIPFDPVALTLGVLLAGGWAFAKWCPHPVLFLVDSLWFFAMGAHLIPKVLYEGRSKGWLALLPVVLWLGFTGIRNFQRYRGLEISRARD
jgi:hypothetical protein